MTDIENLLTDDDFKTGFEPEVVPAGKYRMMLIKGAPRIKVSKSGNRYLTVRLVAKETQDGERVNSKVIYHSIPFEGVNKNGNSNKGMFAGFFSALGLEKDQVKDLYANLLSEAPAPDVIGDREEVTLKLAGEVFDLGGRELMASVKQDTYNEVTRNVVGSVWTLTE